MRTARLLLLSVASLSGSSAPASDALVEQVGPFFTAYCMDCHSGGPDAAEAGVDFQASLSLATARTNRAHWNQVRGLIELGAMPPADHEPQPNAAEREAAAEAIDRLINWVDCNQPHEPPPVVMRRLNRVEYDNTVRDLLGIDFRPADFVGLPADNVASGFDNQGEVLSFSPLLLEKYLDAAEATAARTVVTDRKSLRRSEQPGGRLFEGQQFERRFWLGAGRYKLVVWMRFGEHKAKHKVGVELLVDKRVVHSAEVDNEGQTVTAEVEVDAGWRTIAVRFADDPRSGQAVGQQHQLKVPQIKVRGPLGGDPTYPPWHRGVVAHTPGAGRSALAAARENFARLMPRAFRRPVSATEIERHAALVSDAVRQGFSFEVGMARGLQAVLVSPHFLFRVESPAGDAPLNDYEIASRLSYFLWASMPDEELLAAAARGDLSDPAKLRAETERLLRDPRSQSLVRQFFDQWLGLGKLGFVSPDEANFPSWNDRLRAAMREETHRLAEHVLRKDASLFDLFDADYTFLNPRLAEHYGVAFEGRDPLELYDQAPGRSYRRKNRDDPRPARRQQPYLLEDRWVRVATPPGRRGVLTHASVLTLTSNPRATSPVQRGKWVLDTLLGDPPPPAPPSVPDLAETAAGAEKLPLREQLKRHRLDPGCASCHQQMDPIGLALENFDPIGRWRETDPHGNPIDPTGELRGEPFDDALGLIAVVRKREADLARHFAGRLMVYALGRGLRPADRCEIDQIVEDAKQNDYRLSSFLHGVVTSRGFRRLPSSNFSP